MAKRIIGSGAEAVIYLDKNAIKDRVRKSHRIKEIDERLRKSRTRREAKIFDKLAAMDFPAPRLVKSDDKEILEMKFIKGQKIRDILEKSDYVGLSREIGKKIAVLHNNEMIHGDLTTSNMILEDSSKQIHFIDFGLGFFSHKIEDMAVDLHLLKQALESKHYTIWEECFKAALDAYKNESKCGDLVLERLEIVEGRGRYKRKRALSTILC